MMNLVIMRDAKMSNTKFQGFGDLKMNRIIAIVYVWIFGNY